MSDDEYRAFLEYLFQSYVRYRLHGAEKYFERRRGHHYCHHELRRLRRAMHIIRYIQSYCDDTDEIYATFKKNVLRRVADDVRGAVYASDCLAEDFGFLDAIDAHYPEIVSGMKLEHFPEGELSVLRELGSEDPKRDIQAIIHILKARQPPPRFQDQPSVRAGFSRSVKELSTAVNEMSEEKNETEAPKKSRRWFIGLGQIAQGAALSIADIGLAAGIFPLPVSAETQTYGALVSTTTGVGMIMTGVGELQGE